MRLFRSAPGPGDIATIRAKLTSATAEIEAAESVWRSACFAAVQSGDDSEADAAIEKLARAKRKEEIMRAALERATEVEAERLHEARSASEKAQQRAISQHLGGITRAARDLEEAQISAASAFKRMVAAATSARAALPNRLRGTGAGLEDALREDNLRQLVEIAAYRLAPEGRPRPRGISVVEVRETGHVPPLERLIAERVTQPIRSAASRISPLPAKAQEAPGISPPSGLGEEDAPTSIIDDVCSSIADDRGTAAPESHACPAPAPVPAGGRLTGIAIDLRAGGAGLVEMTERFPKPAPAVSAAPTEGEAA
jgi:hypothetical protein